MTTFSEILPPRAGMLPLTHGEQANVDSVKRWRKATRQALLAHRLALADADHAAWSAAIERHLARAFHEIEAMTIGFYWPHQREFETVVQAQVRRGREMPVRGRDDRCDAAAAC